MAESLGIGRFPFSEEAKTNLVGMFHMIKSGHRVCMDSEIDNEICVEKDDKVRAFTPSEEGSHFHNIDDSSLIHDEKTKVKKWKKTLKKRNSKQHDSNQKKQKKCNTMAICVIWKMTMSFMQKWN